MWISKAHCIRASIVFLPIKISTKRRLEKLRITWSWLSLNHTYPKMEKLCNQVSLRGFAPQAAGFPPLENSTFSIPVLYFRNRLFERIQAKANKVNKRRFLWLFRCSSWSKKVTEWIFFSLSAAGGILVPSMRPCFHFNFQDQDYLLRVNTLRPPFPPIFDCRDIISNRFPQIETLGARRRQMPIDGSIPRPYTPLARLWHSWLTVTKRPDRGSKFLSHSIRCQPALLLFRAPIETKTIFWPKRLSPKIWKKHACI